MRRINLLYPLLASAFVLFPATGCIKEDRTDCPCSLVMDFSEVDTNVVHSADLRLMSADGFEYSDRIVSPDFGDYHVTVPRTDLQVCLWAGTGHCLNGDMTVSIPYGEESPRLFLHVSEADSRCESWREKIILRKNHCVLTIQVEGGGIYPYKLAVKGKVDGYGTDFQPTVGDFMCKAVPDTSGVCNVVLPRQLDSSLMLEIDDGTESVKTFSLGEYIAAGGYDWKDPDLDDVTVNVDYSLTEVVVEVVEWDNVDIYDIVI